MPRKPELTEQEWSHFFDVADMDDDSLSLSIEPSQEEVEDMTRRLKVNEINNVKADLQILKVTGSGAYYVSGTVGANVTQDCVVTLEPVETGIEEQIEGWFADKDTTVSFAAAKRQRDGVKHNGEIEILDEADDPEPLVDGVIDLGELVTQHLSLAIPPYPHKDGVQYEVGDDSFKLDENSPLKKNPFEALKDWKENR